MNDINECYRILELTPGASREEIRQAHRDLLMVWHPDRFPANPRLQSKAQQKTAEVNEAYQQIEAALNSDRRAAAPGGRRDAEPEPTEQQPAHEDEAHKPFEEEEASGEESTPHRWWRRPAWSGQNLRYVMAAVLFLVATALVASLITRVVRFVNARGAEVAKTESAQAIERDRPAPRWDLAAFEEAVEKNPRDPAAYYRLGVKYAEMGRYEDALAALRNAVKYNPDYAEAYLRMGLIYGTTGRYDQAVQVYRQAIRSRPDSATAYYKLSEAYVRLGERYEAAEAYRQALQRAPEEAAAYKHLENLLVTGSDPT